MPKPSSLPHLYDHCLTLSITDLKRFGYIKTTDFKSGQIDWSFRYGGTASISITVNTFVESPYVELDYLFKGEPRNYKVQLVSVPSNLGKGELLYFLCPQTGKRCRKLYSVNGYFLHREAFSNCMYLTQTQSNFGRFSLRMYDRYNQSVKAKGELRSKHFKKFYKGKPTRRYLRLLERIRRMEHVSYRQIEELMIK